ncbi:flippase [Vibrio intestinalis]|uniref:flippase n=1 Tax=Vibrio intestinalis TaxID=2933291 RepID=UPI0021A8AB7B|nr:flippase [Vibrio intestinalis]
MNSFVKQFFGTAGLQFLSKGISVLSGVIFARFLGAEQYGIYTYIFSIVTIAGIPVIAGLPALMVREIANFQLEKKWPLLYGILWWSRGFVFLVSSIIVLVMLGLAYVGYFEPYVAALLLIAVWVIPLRGIAYQQDAVLNGFRKPVLAQIPSKLLAPIITLSTLLFFVITDRPLTSKTLIEISVVALLFTCILSFVLVRYVIKKNSQPAKAEFKTKQWSKALLPFAIITFVSTLNSELAIVLLGWLSDLESVAYFRVATQAVLLISIVVSSISPVLMPNIARLYKSGDLEQTQAILSRAVRLTVLVATPIFLVLLFGGGLLISILFGDEYLSAYPALIILCFGHFISLMMGSVGLVLNMTNNENRTLRSLAIAVTVNLILLFGLIPLYNEIGAAIGVALSLIICNGLMMFDVRKITRLKTWLSLNK